YTTFQTIKSQSNKVAMPFKSTIFFTLFALMCALTVQSQNEIKVPKGYTPQIGSTVSMMEDLKERVTRSVRNLSQEETDFLLDANANRIGAMIMHLAAVEKYYQVRTFENREFNREENKFWGAAMDLGDKGRESLINKPISYYLKIWDDVRKESLRLLKSKDDKWFKDKVNGMNMNNHWAWYHVMEHQANHMGQIRMISKRF
ncbi:MAG: DinB family protein, partial [Bacteroidota bacterium]